MNGDDTYQFSAIRDFVQTQSNLDQSDALTDPLLDEGIGAIDVLFRFTDDEQQTPALGFRHATDDLYTLVYLDPSIATLWSDEME